MVLGIRCSNTDYAYVILEGTRNNPTIVEHDTVTFPVGFNKAQSLKWMADEVRDRVRLHDIASVVMKGPEGLAERTSSLLERIEYEAAVYIACAECGVKISKKVKSTLAKDLGMKGKAKYLSTMDTSAIPDFNKLSVKTQEALQAAWSELR